MTPYEIPVGATTAAPAPVPLPNIIKIPVVLPGTTTPPRCMRIGCAEACTVQVYAIKHAYQVGNEITANGLVQVAADFYTLSAAVAITAGAMVTIPDPTATNGWIIPPPGLIYVRVTAASATPTTKAVVMIL